MSSNDGESSTYDVRVWGVSKRSWRTGITYRVRWLVQGKEWHDSFATRALAESFRADLLSAARRGAVQRGNWAPCLLGTPE